MAGPFYKPYINENRGGIIKQYEQLPVDPAQKDDNGYRHKLAAELKLYEKTQHDQKTRLQDSLKTSLKHQLELKNYQKENAFRMTKREKDINRTGLHVKFLFLKKNRIGKSPLVNLTVTPSQAGAIIPGISTLECTTLAKRISEVQISR